MQNRMEMIRAYVPGIKWLHCPGKQNPADIPSRELNITDRHNREIWLKGPEFLLKQCPTPIVEEIKESEDGRTNCKSEMCMVVSEETNFGIGNVIDVTRLSTLKGL